MQRFRPYPRHRRQKEGTIIGEPDAARAPTHSPGLQGTAPKDASGDPPTSRPEPSRDAPYGLARSTSDRVVFGVAGGIGRRLGVDSVLVRLAFITLATAGGTGILAYLAGRSVLPADDDLAGELPRRQPTARGALALGCVTLGTLLLLRAAGLWLGDAVVWSVTLAAAGSALVWTRASPDERARWAAALARRYPDGVDLRSLERVGRWRLLIGGALVVAGMGVFLAGTDALSAARDVAFAVAVTVAGLALILGPWIQRLIGQVRDERRERIRADERADMAAHLHDSVLQTLAMIQRAGSADEMVRLARGQERTLRAWLLGRDPQKAPARMGAALQAAAAAVEERWEVSVDVVLVGDTDLDGHLSALVEAAAEAMTNAARHSGDDTVAVYAEVEPHQVTVFVRDEGHGFDASDVPPDRRGITESLKGRMARHGGTAEIATAPGEGTEVELQLPVTTTSRSPA